MPFFIPYLREGIQWDLNFGSLADIPQWKPDPSKNIPGYTGWHSNGKPFRYVSDDDRDPMPDETTAKFAVNVFRQKHDKPFFLGVGFIRPHTPLYAPRSTTTCFPSKASGSRRT